MRSTGSPPHGRGKEASIFDDGQRLGITPAWAGKSVPEGARQFVFEDHPRVGGEKLMGRPRRSVGAGSPPHERGKGPAVVYLSCKERITPAWAGKSPEFRLPYLQSEDHPRTGGEKQCSLFEVCAQEGSPLRRRGKARFRVGREMAVGITPAQAGKSANLVVHGVLVQDHPRMDGEKF